MSVKYWWVFIVQEQMWKDSWTTLKFGLNFKSTTMKMYTR